MLKINIRQISYTLDLIRLQYSVKLLSIGRIQNKICVITNWMHIHVIIHVSSIQNFPVCLIQFQMRFTVEQLSQWYMIPTTIIFYSKVSLVFVNLDGRFLSFCCRELKISRSFFWTISLQRKENLKSFPEPFFCKDERTLKVR